MPLSFVITKNVICSNWKVGTASINYSNLNPDPQHCFVFLLWLTNPLTPPSQLLEGWRTTLCWGPGRPGGTSTAGCATWSATPRWWPPPASACRPTSIPLQVERPGTSYRNPGSRAWEPVLCICIQWIQRPPGSGSGSVNPELRIRI